MFLSQVSWVRHFLTFLLSSCPNTYLQPYTAVLLFVSEGSALPSQRSLVGFSWLLLWHSPCVAERLLPCLGWVHPSLYLFSAQGQSPKVSQPATHTHTHTQIRTYALSLPTTDSLYCEIGNRYDHEVVVHARLRKHEGEMPAWHPNLSSWQPDEKPISIEKKKRNSKSSAYPNCGLKRECDGAKKKRQAAADSWCLWGIQVERSMFLEHKIWGKYFDIFPKPAFDDFYAKQRTLQTFWLNPLTPTLPQHIAPVQLFSCYSVVGSWAAVKAVPVD